MKNNCSGIETAQFDITYLYKNRYGTVCDKTILFMKIQHRLIKNTCSGIGTAQFDKKYLFSILVKG